MRTSKYLLLISILFFLLVEPLLAQKVDSEEPKREEITYPNIIKINSLALLLSNASLVYERGIIPRVSAGIGLGYKYAGTEPKLLSVSNSEIEVELDKIQGFSITPEAKYYIRSCDPSKLEGFYIGLYLRYTGNGTAADFEYNPEYGSSELYHSDVRLNEYGVGLQLGYQLIIKERLSIDFLFFGPRYSSYYMTYEFTDTPSQEFLDDLSLYLNEIIDRFGFDYNVDIQKDGDARASTSFLFANTRFGISLGFAF